MIKANLSETPPLEDLRASITSKIAVILSYTSPFPTPLTILMFIIYHIQILLIIFKPAAISIKAQGMTSTQIFNNIYDTLFFEEIKNTTKSLNNVILILSGIGVYLLVDVSLVLYIARALYKRKEVYATVEKISQSLAYMHNLILFYPIHMFCCRVLYLLSNGEDLIISSVNSALFSKAFCIVILIINSSWCLMKMLLFTINLKTKDPLSRKTNIITLLDFAFRVILPILQAFALPDEKFVTALLAVNLVFSLLRDFLLFYTLPYYKISTLKIATISHAVITSLAFSALISRPISQSRNYPELEFLLPVWILCIIVLGKLYTRYLNILLQTIFQHSANITNPHHLIHYLRVYKLYAKCSLPSAHTEKVKEKHFIYKSIVRRSAISDLLLKQNLKLNHKTQALIDQYFLRCHLDVLKIAMKKNPKFYILRTTLSHYYTKYEKLYVLANRILSKNLQNSFSTRNSYFLIKKIMLHNVRKIESDQWDDINVIDTLAVQKYVHMQERYKNMKDNMIQQLRIGVQFWKQFQSQNPDYLLLANIADKVFIQSKYRKKNKVDYKAFLEAGFCEPLLVGSLFFFFGDNDIMPAQKLFKEYSNSRVKAITHSTEPAHFSSESFYILLILSQEQFGIVLDCSGNVEEIYGIPKEIFVKRQLSILMPQVYSKYYENLLRSSLTDSNSEFLNKTLEVPIIMKDGYIMSHWLHIIFNFINQFGFGLCFSGALNPQNNGKRMVVITEDGLILEMSREFSEDMNVDIELCKERKAISVYTFCPSLEEILKNLLLPVDEGIEEDKKPEIAIQEFNLVFSYNFNREPQCDPNLSAHEVRKVIEYKAKIRMIATYEGQFFELTMEKTNNSSEEILIRKGSMTKTGLAENNIELDASRYQSYKTLPLIQKVESSPRSLSPTIKYRTGAGESLSVFKIEKEELINKIPIPRLEALSENATNRITLMSAMSEARKLINFPKGDSGNDMDMNSEGKSPKELKDLEKLDSLSIDQQQEINQKSPILDFMNVLEADTGVLFSNMKRTDAYQEIRRVTNSESYQKSACTFIFCFIVTLAVQMIFLIWLNVYTPSVSQDIGTLSQVIQSSYFRSYWIKIMNQDILICAVVRAGWYNFDLSSVEFGLTIDTENTNKYNQDLMNSLSYLDEDTQRLFYEKNIRIYERDSLDNLHPIAIDDTFEATKKIINYGLRSINDSDRVFSGPDILDRDTKFVIDNSLNDLLAVSEDLTAFVEAKLFNMFVDAKGTMKAAMFVGISVIILFIFVSLKYVLSLNKKSNNFMNMLSSFELDEVRKTENYLSIFMELLENDASDVEILDSFSRATSRLQRRATYTKNINQDTNKRNKTVQKASMRKFNLRTYFRFVGLFICLGLVVGFIVIYYVLASGKIVTMERQHTSLNSALNFVNIVSYLIPQLEVLSLLNGTTTTENIPALNFLNDSASKLTKISEFQESLKDANGDTPAFQQEILVKYSCSKAETPYYSLPLYVLEPECIAVSDGLNYIGLLNMIIQLQQSINQFIWDFENQPRDALTLQKFYDRALKASYYTDMGYVLLLQSYAYSVETFGELVVELEDERVVLAWIAVLLSVFLGAVTWFFIVKRLIRKELQQKRILALMPTRLIFGNYLLMKYITKLK